MLRNIQYWPVSDGRIINYSFNINWLSWPKLKNARKTEFMDDDYYCDGPSTIRGVSENGTVNIFDLALSGSS